MGLGFYSSGTTGAIDGTSIGSSGSPIVLRGLGIDTAKTLYMRCTSYGSSGVTMSEVSGFSGDIEVSPNNSTWYALGDFPSTAVNAYNVPVYFRQAEYSNSSVGTFKTTGTYTNTISTLEDVTGFSATSSGTVIKLAWNAVTNRSHYQVDRATNSGFTAGVSLNINSSSSGISYNDSSGSAGNTYYYRIKAHGETIYLDSTNYVTTSIALSAVEALTDVTGFTAAASASLGTTISLSWNAVANRNHYQIDRATDSGFTANVVTNINSSGTTTSFDDTGKTVGTTYYYRIKAHGDGINYTDSENYATANATANVGFIDSFSSIDTDRWGTAIAGSVSAATSSGGRLVFGGTFNGSDDGAIIYLKSAYTQGDVRTFTAKLTSPGLAYGNSPLMALWGSSTTPSIRANTGYNRIIQLTVGPKGASDFTPSFNFNYWNTSNTVYYWNQTSPTAGSWGTSSTAAMEYTGADVRSTDFYMRLICDATGVTWQVLNSAGSNLFTSSQVAWSTIKDLSGGESFYLILGEPYSDFYYANISVDQFTLGVS